MDDTFLSAAILLLLVTDPLGNMPLFIVALKPVAQERRLRVIVREVLIAYGVLLIFMLFGKPIMTAMRLSDTSLGIAGGVVLFLIALKMIFPPAEGMFGKQGKGEPLIVPLAIPFLAGPSALATVLLLVARDPAHLWQWVLALTLVMTINALVLGFAEKIAALLGEQVVNAFERLMGLILTAIATEMLLSGVRDFVKEL